MNAKFLIAALLAVCLMAPAVLARDAMGCKICEFVVSYAEQVRIKD